MGAKDSKRSCLSYEDAVKRMTDVEFRRVCEAYKRLTNSGQLLSRHSFTQHVLGEGVPATIADRLYTACGGTARGISLRDLICGLVLLTKGKQDEKIKFLWTLYSGDSGLHVTKAEFQSALQMEGCPTDGRALLSLFGMGQDKVAFDHFRAWIAYNREATVLSRWLLSSSSVSLSSELETPTFYQTLAGVTHLEEQDICELEKCFWALQGGSPSGHLDLECLRLLVCPPVPPKLCRGLFSALDVNRDEHVDFKELCCGISAACRGPMVERMKFCFKLFDMDKDLYLNAEEVDHMTESLVFVAADNVPGFPKADRGEADGRHSDALDRLKEKLDAGGGLTLEDFLVWSVEDNGLVGPLLELLFQVCHVSLGLKPQCRHDEYDIVTGWLEREERRGYQVGQFWYLVSSDWWQQWQGYASAPRSGSDACQCPRHGYGRNGVEEGIACDESLISNTTDYASNEFNSTSMESMGDLLSRGDSCSIASSSGVSSSSGTTGAKRSPGQPGPIDNSFLVAESLFKVPTLTGEGGRLKRDTTLVQHRDFELVPDSLWKALSMWYGGPLPLPRQVIGPPGRGQVELELYPLNLGILRHQTQQSAGAAASWSSVVGGYGAAALSTAGLASSVSAATRRVLAHTAAFSRLSTVLQVTEFLCQRLNLRPEDARLWLLGERRPTGLLDDDDATLQDLGVAEADQILLEVRNKDLTWPEELGQLAASGGHDVGLSVERRPTICLPPGATGLHNLGNTCFMNAALQAVSNTRPLTMYFQRDGQLSELNAVNPLGTKGAVARKYAELCRELWAGSTRSVAPLKLRYCVTKHAPHLGGGGQHDSQELLAWLLDALHEDLNRVARKQYTELKDSAGRPDEVVAEEAWQQQLARDNSIVTDLFYGQLKSKVTCQKCRHESVRFDPFNLLSLPLPMESFTLCEVLVVKLNGECPTKYGVRLNSEARYSELKSELFELSGIAPRNLLLAEIAHSQVKQFLGDGARVSPTSATEIYAYEVPDQIAACNGTDDEEGVSKGAEERTEGGGLSLSEIQAGGRSPSARSPENVRGSRQETGDGRPSRKPSASMHFKSAVSANSARRRKCYFVAVHRKCVRQEAYFLSQQKSRPSLFGVPLLLSYDRTSGSCQSLYKEVWDQVTRLLSPMPQSDQTNHATDCDDSLRYEFPFTLKAVLPGGQVCALCHWTNFCRGCLLPCTDARVTDTIGADRHNVIVAIDWDPTALHLRYQSNREKLWLEHESVAQCRKRHTEPIDLDYCLRAFTSEESLEAKYHCSNCQEKQPATKKLQIWRLPPILIVHLKRFDFINGKWAKTQKAVNFPFKDFDPTAYLASVPQETILRHKQIKMGGQTDDRSQDDCEDSQCDCIAEESSVSTDDGDKSNAVAKCNNNNNKGALVDHTERCKLLTEEEKSRGESAVRTAAEGNGQKNDENNGKKKNRARLESTSLKRTPIMDGHLKDYHRHQMLPGQDPFDLKYQLYAVISHSGLINGGHYISYACNPNGHWYCYNDSSCREVLASETPDSAVKRSHASSIGQFPNENKNSANASPVIRRKASSISSNEEMNVGSRAVFNENGADSSEELLRDATESSDKSTEERRERFRCPYGEVSSPSIDTSSAYILFYERSGLDYKPYLPGVQTQAEGSLNGRLQRQACDDAEDSEESEFRKQLCSIQ